jgi:hypothetical protein
VIQRLTEQLTLPICQQLVRANVEVSAGTIDRAGASIVVFQRWVVKRLLPVGRQLSAAIARIRGGH